MRRHLTYANVVSTLCLFVLLSGTAYAAATITGKDVKNSSLTGKDVKNSSLTGKDIKDSSLTGKDVADRSLGLGELAGNLLPGARVQTQAVLVVPAGASNPVDLSEEEFDTGGMHAPAADYIVITRPGTYLISGYVAWTADAGGSQRQVRIVVDDEVPVRALTFGYSGPQSISQEVNSIERLAVGQTVSLGLYKGGTGSTSLVDVSGDAPNAALTVQMISP